MLFFPLSFSDFELDPQRRCQKVLSSGISFFGFEKSVSWHTQRKKIFLLMLSKRISCGLNFFFSSKKPVSLNARSDH